MLDQILNLVHKIYNIPDLIGWGSYWVLFFIIFAETGLFVGFFLPGDSLLVAAGLFAAAGKLNIWILVSLLSVAAIVGDSTGYWFGEKIGKNLFKKEKSHLFKPKYLLRAKAFYEKHGGKTIIFARFVPVIRTFAPIVAGATNMPYKKFFSFNVIGGILWVGLMTLLGYFIGSLVPDIDKHMGILIISVIVISLIPAIIEYIKEKKKDKSSVPIMPA